MSFSNTNPPKRAGDYTRFVTKQQLGLPAAATSAIVLVPMVDDWGPFKQFVSITSFQDYLATYGQPIDPANPSAGYIAAYNAFKGENANTPGAGQVLFYRMGGSAAAKSSKTLNNTAAAAALVLTAIYEGLKGNSLKVEVVANAANPGTQVDLRIYLDTILVEEYKGYTAAQISNLAAAINASSGWVRASGAVNGTQLTAIAASNFTGGNSGTTLLAGDWTAFMTASEPQRFGYLAPYDLTDDSIRTSIKTWAIALNNAAKSKRFFFFTGGALDENYSTAATRSSGINDENVVNLGVGSYTDTALGKTMSTSQLVPRLAGIASARGGTASLSFAYLADLNIVNGPADSEVLASLDAGVVTLTLGTNGVRIEKGVTTYTTTTNTDKPFKVYSNLKFVTTMQNFERSGRERNENGDRLGRLPVNNDTREFLVSDEQKLLDEFVKRGEVQPGARVVLASDPPITDDDDFIALDWFGKFGRTVEQIRRTIYMN